MWQYILWLAQRATLIKPWNIHTRKPKKKELVSFGGADVQNIKLVSFVVYVLFLCLYQCIRMVVVCSYDRLTRVLEIFYVKREFGVSQTAIHLHVYVCIRNWWFTDLYSFLIFDSFHWIGAKLKMDKNGSHRFWMIGSNTSKGTWCFMTFRFNVTQFRQFGCYSEPSTLLTHFQGIFHNNNVGLATVTLPISRTNLFQISRVIRRHWHASSIAIAVLLCIEHRIFFRSY